MLLNVANLRKQCKTSKITLRSFKRLFQLNFQFKAKVRFCTMELSVLTRISQQPQMQAYFTRPHRSVEVAGDLESLTARMSKH